MAALFVALTSVAAQAQPQPPSPSVVEQPPAPDVTAPLPPVPGPPIEIAAPFTSDQPETGLGAWLSKNLRVGVSCVTCPAGARPPALNMNAPWAIDGTVRYTAGANTFSAGVLGARGYAMPLYWMTPIGGTFSSGTLSTGAVSMAPQPADWLLKAGYERTLFKTKGGATFGFIADALAPMNSNSTMGNGGIGPPGGAAVRVGFVIRW